MRTWLYMIAAAAVFLGGGLGSLLRYALAQQLNSSAGAGMAFPYGTLLANSLGAFFMGLLAIALSGVLHESFWRPLLLIGFLGGLTTFSTYSFETIALFESGKVLTGVIYVISNLLMGLGLVLLGKNGLH